MDHIMDRKTLGDTFQEILAELSEMEPASLDELEKKIKGVLHSLGECMMEWKLGDWDVDLRKGTCWECGGKLENRKGERQIATTVSDVNFQRYRSSCPGCGKIEYPLDGVLGLHPLQRLSWLLTERHCVEHAGSMGKLNTYWRSSLDDE